MAVLTYLRMAPWVAVLVLLLWAGRLNELRDRWHHQYTAEHDGRIADRGAYEQAQKDAAAANKAQVARVKAEQERITGNVEKSYEADLARLRAELGRRLSKSGTAAPQGAAGQPGASDLPNAAPVADDPTRLSIPSSLYVRGAELELQLERLQQWIDEQLKVDPNKQNNGG
jgi:hypothetical protein